MLLQQLINGVSMGLIYALVALGYTMVYGILKIVNFAHGGIYMFGAFFTITLINLLQLNFYAAVLLSSLVTMFLGVAIERIAYRPLRNSNRITPLISALGVSIVLDRLAILFWGADTQVFPSAIANSKTFQFAGCIISKNQIVFLIITLSLMILLMLLINNTKIGLAMRATSINNDIAQLMGVNTNLVISITFAIGSSLAAIAGSLVGVYYNSVYSTMGYLAGMKAFTAAVLGGIGSIRGAVIGSLVIGVTEAIGSAYLGSQYQDIISFVILSAILIIRPTGLFGQKTIDKV